MLEADWAVTEEDVAAVAAAAAIAAIIPLPAPPMLPPDGLLPELALLKPAMAPTTDAAVVFRLSSPPALADPRAPRRWAYLSLPR